MRSLSRRYSPAAVLDVFILEAAAWDMVAVACCLRRERGNGAGRSRREARGERPKRENEPILSTMPRHFLDGGNILPLKLINN